MTTTKNRRPFVKEAEKNAILDRLERNQKDLEQLRQKLSSYRYEPRTYSLFERIENLRRSMDNLDQSNGEIIYALKEPKKTIDDYLARAKDQVIEFKRLNDGVKEYLTHCLGRRQERI